MVGFVWCSHPETTRAETTANQMNPSPDITTTHTAERFPQGVLAVAHSVPTNGTHILRRGG